jgi:hypothetical protein
MSKASKVARTGDNASVGQSKIARGGNQKPNGDLKSVARKGGDLPQNPNASHDPKGAGTH